MLTASAFHLIGIWQENSYFHVKLYYLYYLFSKTSSLLFLNFFFEQIINAIADAVRATEGVTLLDVDPGASTNRTVYTFVGTPGQLFCLHFHQLFVYIVSSFFFTIFLYHRSYCWGCLKCCQSCFSIDWYDQT